MTVYKKTIASPLGMLTACAVDEGICLLEFSDKVALNSEIDSLKKDFSAEIMEGDHPHLALLEGELTAYFSGELKEFTVPILSAGTDFQKNVWSIIRQIPYGTTLSYAAQADKLGNPAAVRAVAAANGKNKICILIPCHRVIGSSGALTGYSGGLDRKKALLKLEKPF